LHAALIFKTKWFGDNTDGERSNFSSNTSYYRCATSSGATTFTSRDENHVCAEQNFADFICMVLGCLSTNFWVRSGTETFSELTADIEFDVRIGHEEILGVSINSDELNTFESGINHAIDGLATASAYANNFDDGEVVLS
jgi:hypothetical protein